MSQGARSGGGAGAGTSAVHTPLPPRRGRFLKGSAVLRGVGRILSNMPGWDRLQLLSAGSGVDPAPGCPTFSASREEKKIQGGCHSRVEKLSGTVVGRNWVVVSRRSSDKEHPGARWWWSLDRCPGSGQAQGYWAEATVAAARIPSAGASSG